MYTSIIKSAFDSSTFSQRIFDTLLTVFTHSMNHRLGLTLEPDVFLSCHSLGLTLEPDAFLSCIIIIFVSCTVLSNTIHLHTHNRNQSILFEVCIIISCNNNLTDKASRSSIFFSSLILKRDEFSLNFSFWI